MSMSFFQLSHIIIDFLGLFLGNVLWTEGPVLEEGRKNDLGVES